jgi:hypothetical protein
MQGTGETEKMVKTLRRGCTIHRFGCPNKDFILHPKIDKPKVIVLFVKLSNLNKKLF